MGGSPVARPISLCAMAKRVRESIIRSTSRPLSRKYSAIVVATRGAFRRSMAGWSEVATTRMVRFMPSSPRSFSTNSRISRPRSPTRAITLISAFTFLAIMPIKVDFPTPEPAKIPIRCPFPMVFKPSIALMPKCSLSLIGGLSKGFI